MVGFVQEKKRKRKKENILQCFLADVKATVGCLEKRSSHLQRTERDA